MGEKRSEPRLRSLKAGHIVFNNRFSTIDCMVRNLSPHGAKLIVGTQGGIPETFDLEFESGGSHTCRVVWRRETELGVAFA